MSHEHNRRPAQGQTVVEFADSVLRSLRGSSRPDRQEIRHAIASVMAMIDAVCSRQVAEIMHDPYFQRLEGSWRGLDYLVSWTDTGHSLRIHVLNVARHEFFKDLLGDVESQIARKLFAPYETEHENPYSVLIGDYEFSHLTEDLQVLEAMSDLAAAVLAPFIASPSPQMFGLDSWQDFKELRSIPRLFDGPQYARWLSFRETENAGFCVLSMPRVMARLPYDRNAHQTEEFSFEETPTDANHQYCWMSPAYALVAAMAASVRETGLATDILKRPVDGLPSHILKDHHGNARPRVPTELALTSRRSFELDRGGFLTLEAVREKNSHGAAFFSRQTCRKAKTYDNPEASGNAAIASRLPFVMVASRFGQYLKVICRDSIGPFLEGADVEAHLNDWLMNYVNGCSTESDSPSAARYPLIAAGISVEAHAGTPGSYNCRLLIQPHLPCGTPSCALQLELSVGRP